jgi:hypothetical protein
VKKVDLADLGCADAGAQIEQEAQRSLGKSEVWVYVLEVTIGGEYSWTSVHTSPEGARARLEEKVDEYGVRDAYEAQLAAEISGETSTAAGDEGDLVVYGISHLPVETP